jgi:hypothetical protein
MGNAMTTQSSQIALIFGTLLAVVAGMGAALVGIGAPSWVWVSASLWALLWLTAASGLTDPASRRFLAGTLKNLGFGQIYGTLARRNVMGLWERYCAATSAGASALELFRAALTVRLLRAALWVAVGYLLVLLVGLLTSAAISGEQGVRSLLKEMLIFHDGRAFVLMALAALVIVLNTFFDFISYALTLALMRRGLRARLPFLWWLLDLVLSGVLFVLLGAALMITIKALTLSTGLPVVDLGTLSASLQAVPGAYSWLWLMLMTTMVPTLLHAALAILGAQGLWPRTLRRPVAAWVERAGEGSVQSLRASLGLSIIWVLPMLLLALGVWIIWLVVQPSIIGAFQRYLALLSAVGGP